jgi:hypothetical protein
MDGSPVVDFKYLPASTCGRAFKFAGKSIASIVDNNVNAAKLGSGSIKGDCYRFL